MYSIKNSVAIPFAASPAVISALGLPFIEQKICAGFESPTHDFSVKTLDLNDLLILNPRSTFYSLVEGTCMAPAGILDGAVVVTDGSLAVRHMDAVFANFDGVLTIKHLYKRGGRVKLVPADSEFPELIPKDWQQLEVLGKVTASIVLFHPLLAKIRRDKNVCPA